MPITLRLRYLWGAPKHWTFVGDDEDALRRMLRDLEPFAADADSRTAVLLAEGADGKLVGSWTRDGVRRLASTIIHDPPSPEWIDVRNALDDAASGP